VRHTVYEYSNTAFYSFWHTVFGAIFGVLLFTSMVHISWSTVDGLRSTTKYGSMVYRVYRSLGYMVQVVVLCII
jgi:hypothetical protein